MELQARQRSRSGEDLRLLEENEELKTVRRRPATAGIRIARGHQVHPLSKEASERSNVGPTLPFNEWVQPRQTDQLSDNNDGETPSTSHSSQPMRGRRKFTRVFPLEEEEDRTENSSINADIFTKATTTSHTDPATGDIVLGSDNGEDTGSVSTGHQLTSHDQSTSLLAPPQLTGKQHAYIPYTVAKETISKICDEMAKMKQRHIRIVDEIDATYNEIEVETQQRFNDFVHRLKGQHSRKFATFKQVIELYEKDLQKNKSYWQSTVESLAAKNKKLLEENRALYSQNKKESELLKAEKEQVVAELTEKVEREKKQRTDECQKAVNIIRSLQVHVEELEQQRQSASEELEATKAQHHLIISEMIEKHLAELATVRESLALETMEQSQLQRSEPSQESKFKDDKEITANKEVLMASIKSSLRLKQKEIDSLQHQFQSVCHLIRNEPALQAAIGGVASTLQEQHEELKQQKISLQQSLKDDFMASYDGKEPTDSDWNQFGPEMKKDLTNVSNELAHCEAKLSAIRILSSVISVDPQLVTADQGGDEEPTSQIVTSGEPSDAANGSQPLLAEYKEVIVSLEKSNMELSTVNEHLTVKVADLENEKASLIQELQRLQGHRGGGATSPTEEGVQMLDDAGETTKMNKGVVEEITIEEEQVDVEESDEETEEEQEAEKTSVQQLEETVTDKEQIASSVSTATTTTAATKQTSAGADKKLQNRTAVKEKQSPDKRGGGGADVSNQEMKKLKEQLLQYKKQQQSDAAQIKSLKNELKTIAKAAPAAGGSAEDKKELKKKEKEIKELVKQFEITKKNLEKAQATLMTTEVELKEMKKSNDKLQEEMDRKQDELSKIAVVAKQAVEAQERVEALAKQLKTQSSELKTLTENYNSERMLRKKYYNMIEDMKGKIRVYCRVRPLSKSEIGMGCMNITESPDEYSINVHSSRGLKEFQFDHIFLPDHGQEMVFEDTHNLVQSAVDGYNVCIFAYGQTGSGKTYTMIGGMEGKKVTLPGIAPRAFERIFHLVSENKKKFSFKISTYMLELYNDRLLDLFNTDHKSTAKLDIKKDKKGLVYVQGSVVKDASSADELYNHFEFGSHNRHTASTKMNSESSRSHLIIGIVIESTNLTTGTITKGKLSLVDLAGSERAAKTEASAEQLKEAQSINKSLSALGDVISALSSGQDFVPYRNNKLTLLMQDSLGGNAKTLMFVNISPADYNMDETVISLTYASRVKLITNDAQKNAENKEIAKLKSIIAKLRRGEDVEDED